MTAVDALLRIPSDWTVPFRDAGFEEATPEAGVVFVAAPVTEDWESVLAELTEAFRLTRSAARAGAPVVYVVHHDDLLGRRGPGPAMVATGLLSAARTTAFEGRKAGTPVNVVAVEDATDPQVVASWAARLLGPGGPTGELLRLGGAHLGKALP